MEKKDQESNIVTTGPSAAISSLIVLGWFYGPVRWMVQGNPGLTEADLTTHALALKEYGLRFYMVVFVSCWLLYLCGPGLWAGCLRLCRRFWPGRHESKARQDETLSAQ